MKYPPAAMYAFLVSCGLMMLLVCAFTASCLESRPQRLTWGAGLGISCLGILGALVGVLL